MAALFVASSPAMIRATGPATGGGARPPALKGRGSQRHIQRFDGDRLKPGSLYEGEQATMIAEAKGPAMPGGGTTKPVTAATASMTTTSHGFVSRVPHT